MLSGHPALAAPGSRLFDVLIRKNPAVAERGSRLSAQQSAERIPAALRTNRNRHTFQCKALRIG